MHSIPPSRLLKIKPHTEAEVARIGYLWVASLGGALSSGAMFAWYAARLLTIGVGLALVLPALEQESVVMRLETGNGWIPRTTFVALLTLTASRALAQKPGFSSSNVQALYGWNFQEPGISADVPKNVFTFENTAAWGWGSSYLFVDVLRSWSAADANAKEVYGEWYPSLSLRHLAGKQPSEGLLRDVGATVGLNGGVRTTGSAPFVVLPGVTFSLNMPGFTFVSVGTFAYIDLSQFQGQPTNCRATTYQVTPSWSLPVALGSARFAFDGFVDFIGRHGACQAMVISQPQVKLDLSGLWHDPGRLYLGMEFDYWHNKYGISGLEDDVALPLLIWKF